MNNRTGTVNCRHNRCRALRMELQRAICSTRFLVSIGMAVAWMSLNAAEAVKTYEHAAFAGMAQLIRLGMNGHQSIGPVFLAISTLPYALSYLTEKECGFQQQVVSRIGVAAYGFCKVIAVAVSAFLVGAASLLVFVGILSSASIPHTVRYDEVKTTYAILAIVLGPGWYYAIEAFRIGLVCSQAALFSLMIMAWIPNVYVGFLSPLIGYYVADCAYNLMGTLVSSPFWCLFSPPLLFFNQPLPDIVFSYLWTVLILEALSVCFSVRFLLQMEKEYA